MTTLLVFSSDRAECVPRRTHQLRAKSRGSEQAWSRGEAHEESQGAPTTHRHTPHHTTHHYHYHHTTTLPHHQTYTPAHTTTTTPPPHSRTAAPTPPHSHTTTQPHNNFHIPQRTSSASPAPHYLVTHHTTGRKINSACGSNVERRAGQQGLPPARPDAAHTQPLPNTLRSRVTVCGYVWL